MIDALLTYLPSDFPWKDRIHYFDTIDSTNTRAKELAAQSAPHGTVLLADRQTGGRGRMGRSFHSPAGKGIYLSVILRPGCHASQLMHLTCAAGTAMCDAVEKAAGLRPGIKWTNDLVVGSRKLGGILTELSLNPDGTVACAVVGIGINCSHAAEDFPEDIRSIATSLHMVSGSEISREQMIAAMLESLEAMSRELLTGKEAIMAQYRTDCVTLGRQISVVTADRVRHGIARDIDQDGGLIVEFPDGHLEAVSSGEVSIRGMYGYI